MAGLRISLDQDIDILSAQLLTPRGFNCLTTRDAGRLGRPDGEQLGFATSQGRILVTHNRVHFERLAVEWMSDRREHAGIVVLGRQSRPHPTHLTAQKLGYA